MTRTSKLNVRDTARTILAQTTMELLSFLPPSFLSKPSMSPELWRGGACQFTGSNLQDTIPRTEFQRKYCRHMEQAAHLNIPPSDIATAKQIIQLCRKLLIFFILSKPPPGSPDSSPPRLISAFPLGYTCNISHEVLLKRQTFPPEWWNTQIQ